MCWIRATALVFFALSFGGVTDAAISQPVPPPVPPMPAELEFEYRFTVPGRRGVLRIVGEGKLPLEIPGAGSFNGEGNIGYTLQLPPDAAGCTHNFPSAVRHTFTGVREPATPVDKLPIQLTSHPPAVPAVIRCPDGGAVSPVPYTGGSLNLPLVFADRAEASLLPPEGVPGVPAGMIEGKITLNLVCAVPASGGSVVLVFLPEIAAVSEDTSRTKAQVDRLAQSSARSVPLLGLTRPKPPLPPETAVAPWFTPAENGTGWCLEIQIGITFPQVEMLIPREYATRACNYRATKEHETRHVQAYLGLVTTAKDEIRQAIERARVPSKARPTYVRSEAEKELFSQTWESYIKNGLLAPIYAKFTRDLKAANDRLNTLSEHARVVRRCPSW